MKITKHEENHGQSLQPMSLRDAMNRLFDEALWSPFDMLHADGGRLVPAFPRVDIAETETTYTLKADVPDVDPEKIDIEATDDSLSISGSVERSSEIEEDSWKRVERERGHFHRTFSFPLGIKKDSITAKAKHGVLTIVVEKARPQTGSAKVRIDVE